MMIHAGAKNVSGKAANTDAKPSGLPLAGSSQAVVQIAAVPEATGGKIPMIMPEKLAKGRFLVELEPLEGGATDLTGDAGAVGRFSLSGKTFWFDSSEDSRLSRSTEYGLDEMTHAETNVATLTIKDLPTPLWKRAMIRFKMVSTDKAASSASSSKWYQKT